MVDVRRVTLPGVGVLHSFETADGVELAVVAHRTGSSDLVTRPASGDDDAASMVRLDEDEARTLADLLGGTRIVESITELDELPGVPIDWITIDADDAIAGRPLGVMPAAPGVALVAIVRDDHAHPSPAADFVVQAGDTIVAVGPTEGIETMFRAVHDGAGFREDTGA
ncbi:cation:proton antiporter regulatory subunit [Agromyces ramosus]|uniref:TrkA domain protein n=1 Tax=Agromyces ramosus TaxID=33879 RepID=A0ABU0R530_9MICO|nr:TrkA C-terminal domain-containing protein [Agromyces ramosus]MDQ0893175.1 TrkA domain protein [Agromyces ramosus]